MNLAPKGFKRLRRASDVIELETKEDNDTLAGQAETQETGYASGRVVEKMPRSKPPRRKPAGARGDSDFCQGRAGLRCCFSTSVPGQRARSNSGECCIFCSVATMSRACSITRGRGRVVECLRYFRSFYEENSRVYNAAILRVPEEHRDDMHAKAIVKPTQRPRRTSSRSVDWESLLNRRRRAQGPLTSARMKKYQRQVRADRSKVQQKFFASHRLAPPEPKDIAENDAGLPAPVLTERASMVESWCKEGSWAMCQDCGSMNPRRLEPMDCRRVAQATVTKRACKNCSNGKIKIPAYDDIPEPLRDLPDSVIDSLRPLDIDVGPYRRAQYGYRMHTSMIRFAWREHSVESSLRRLPDETRPSARRAYKYLMSCKESAYSDFVARHNKFLGKHPDGAEEKVRKRPLQFLETRGLENCLWPHLYWREDMCETFVRATDSRRVARGRDAAKDGDAGGRESKSFMEQMQDIDNDQSDDDEDTTGRHSIKRSFMRKVLGPLVGYSECWDLLQFIYDLALWSRIGGGKNACKGLALRLVLKGETFSPLYFRTRHQALLDLQRQCGHPQLFKTMAPWEPSFPYHTWILDEMRKCGRRRGGSSAQGEMEQELAGLETLHHAHVFTELERGLYTGFNKRSDSDGKEAWREHILGPETTTEDEPHEETSAGFFFRLEYQDGKRKKATQAYHGSGRVHCHSLNYLENPERVGLHRKISATVPADDQVALKAYMLGRPHTAGAETGWPVFEGESAWDDANQQLLLHHTQEDRDAGHRAYFPETLEIAKCHQDAVVANDRGPLLKYCATYTPKFSDAFQKEWLVDEASAFSVARRVLFDYKPCEPEMWLYLAAKTFPPCRHSGTMVELRAPWPGMPANRIPKIAAHYMSSTWRGAKMTLLEFARKSNEDGQVAHWIKQRHKREAARSSLEAYANEIRMKGEKLVAVDMVSIMNERYFLQWLALHVPFRSLTDLESPEIAEKVPAQYAPLAHALRLRPEFWNDEDEITKALELEAAGKTKVKTFLAKIKAEKFLIGKYLAGELGRDDDPGRRSLLRSAGFGGQSSDEDDELSKLTLNAQQKFLEENIMTRVDFVQKARQVDDEDELDDMLTEARKNARPVAGLGPPGTGKTTVVDRCARKVVRRGGHVLYALPTAQQASRVRARHPSMDVDTCAAAFYLYKKDITEHLDSLNQYDLIVIDEVSQLSSEDFERIVLMWEAAEKLPALILTGDFWQLPGVSGTQANESIRWRQVFVIDLHEMWRCKDPVLRKKLLQLRVSMPDRKQVQEICKGHKAWTHLGDPTLDEVKNVLAKHDCVNMAACTRKAAATLNELSVEVLFGHQRKPLCSLAADWESNPENYDAEGALKSGKLKPLTMKIHAGMRLFLTRNVNKRGDFVNGMQATVQRYDRDSGCLHVLTATQRQLAVFPFTEDLPGGRRLTFWPVRPGYASTIHKLQGAELDNICVWLNVKHFRAGAYVAMSRVQYDNQYVLGGYLEREHFVPAR